MAGKRSLKFWVLQEYATKRLVLNPATGRIMLFYTRKEATNYRSKIATLVPCGQNGRTAYRPNLEDWEVVQHTTQATKCIESPQVLMHRKLKYPNGPRGTNQS